MVDFDVVDISNWEKYVKQDRRFMRPAEVDVLRGDASKAKYELGWAPKTDFQKLVKNMVESDLALLDPKGWKQI